MKIIVVENSPASSPGEMPSLVVYPDSCLLRNNDPFFIPDLQRKVVARAGLLVKIDKIGKHIAPEFASRYYSQAGMAIDFVQYDFEQTLKAMGYNTGPALYFDRSFAVSNDFIDKDRIDSPHFTFTFKVNNAEISMRLSSLKFSIEKALSFASDFFTLKIGDLLFVPALSLDKGVTQGDVIDGVINENLLIRCQVK